MFCPSCARQIPESSAFCLGCGGAIQLVSKTRTATVGAPGEKHKERLNPWMVGALVLLALGAIPLLVFVFSPVPVVSSGAPPAVVKGSAPLPPRPFSTQLMSGSIGISPSQSRFWTFQVSESMINARLVGNFHASGGAGNDIQAVVAESSECENWINGHQARVFYESGKVTNGSIDLPLTKAGSYCLAFSNRMALLSAKTVSGDVALRYLLP